MTRFTPTKHSPLIALLMMGTVAGCGVVYTPQQFEESIVTYGYQGDYSGEIKVVSMNFFSTRIANSDGYVPKALPATFSQQPSIATVSTRDRLAAANLDRVSPALQFEPPAPLPIYDTGTEILPPVLRNENRPPLPSTTLQRRSFDSRAGSQGGASLDGADNLRSLLQQPPAPRPINDRPLPVIQPEDYLIGPGDVIGILSRLQSLSISQPSTGDMFSDAAKELLVQGNGEIYIPQAGPVDVGGLSLTEARSVIFDRLVDNQLDFDFGVEILRFGSKTIGVSGPNQTVVLPVTVKPTTLDDAVFAVGGVGAEPEKTVVRVLRDGEIYEMAGDQLFGTRSLGKRYLKEGDIVSVATSYDVKTALDYFDQQLRLRQFEMSERDVGRANLQFEMEMENYRFQAEKLRQENELNRLSLQRENEQLNEQARVANIEARQAYLDRLRTLRESNAQRQREAEEGRREALVANIGERERERRERRELLEMELEEERLRLTLERDRVQQERSLFNERVRLGAVQQDYVTIAGEINRQTVMPLPFNGKMTLNRVLYEETNGVNLLTGDTSEIYVIRTSDMESIEDPLTAYHLDASNPAALAVASMFEMRPNDVVYVNPQPVTNWNRVISLLLPSTGLLQSGLSTATGLSN